MFLTFLQISRRLQDEDHKMTKSEESERLTVYRELRQWFSVSRETVSNKSMMNWTKERDQCGSG